MTSIIEKVARALCKAADDDWDWSVFYIVDGNDTAETAQNLYRGMARAAIQAMREMTPAMSKAADIPGWDDSVTIGLGDEIWEAAIDAALKEE